MRIRFSLLLAVCADLASARLVPGDSRRGAALFESQHCVSCHGAPGRGGGSAPDLGRWTGRAFTPASLATYLWNHAPAMWSAMKKAGIETPSLDEQQSADLFAYFHAHRYFEAPGEAGRGKQVFASAHCGACHPVRGKRSSGAPPPVETWENVADPVSFTSSLWNHSARMYAEMKSRKLDWPDLSAQQLTDLLVYVRRLPGAHPADPVLNLADASEGEAVFRSKGCMACHGAGPRALEQMRRRTLAGFAVAMWNHAPRMAATPPQLNPLEMQEIAGYLWSISYFDEPGDEKAGAKVYARNGCQGCHASSTWMAPSLTRRAQPLHAIGVVSALWRHGPAMQARMQEQKMAWPLFKNNEMADLIAYVNSKRD